MKIQDIFRDRSQPAKRIVDTQTKVHDGRKTRQRLATEDKIVEDRITLSEEGKRAQRMAELVQKATERLAQEPDVRADAVRLAKERLRAGWYDRDDVLRETAARLIASRDVLGR